MLGEDQYTLNINKYAHASQSVFLSSAHILPNLFTGTYHIITVTS